jgi:CHAT domain-containing protein
MTFINYNHKYSLGLLLLILIAGFISVCSCKQNNHSDPASLLANAKALNKSKNFDEALVAYKNVLPLLRANDDSLYAWLRARRDIATILDVGRSKKKEALDYIDSTLIQLETWRQPNSYKEKTELYMIHMREFKASLDYGDLMRAKSAISKCEKIFDDVMFGKSHNSATYLYKETANLYVRLGEFGDAVNYFNKSISYEKQFNKKNIVNYNDYGSVYLSLQDYSTALQLFQKGLSIDSVDHFNRTLLHLNKSEALANLDNLPQAQQWNNLALKMLELKDEFDDDDYLKCKIGYLENEAIIQEKKQNWTAARAFYDKILSPEQLPKIQRREIAGYLNASANTFLEQKNYPKALEQYHAAYLKFFPKASQDLPNPDELPADKILADILEGKARCWAAMGQYDQSIAAYLLIPVIENQLRATHTFETSMLLALQKSRHRLNDAVDIAWDAWQKTGNRVYAEKAFLFTEMARGTLQTKGINANEALALLTPNQQEEDKNWSNKIAICENQLAEAEDEAKINALMQEIRQLKNQQKATRTQIASTNPAYAATMGNNHILQMKDVTALLRPGQTMLDYYLIDTNQLYVFAFDHLGNAAWNRLAWSSTTQATTIDLVRQISDNNPNTTPQVFSNTARMLGQKLLVEGIGNTTSICQGNAMPKLDSALVIVPDLVLTALPFEVLLTENTTATDWSDLPYLVKKHSISYAFSASLLALQKTLTEKRKGKARLPFAGFAPTYSNNADRLDSAATDVTYCAQLFNGKAYLHPDATEAQFRAISEEAQILLLSMHGNSDHVHPGLSRLRFGDTNEGKDGDNILHASELQGIPCRADLAVMSACFTGDGPVQVGEGVYSIARSFAVSGVPATAMSLWKFPVISSSNLVRDFLLGIKNQNTKDGALQHAKLTWLQDHPQSKYAHPYYWAGLVTAGDASVLKMSKKGFDYWYFALGALVLALLVGVLKLNRDFAAKNTIS